MNWLRTTLLFSLLTPAFAADLPAHSIAMTIAQQQRLGITVASPEAVTTAFGQELPAQVTVPPSQVRLVTAPQAGLLEQLHVAVGEEVVIGQVLAQLRSPALVALQRDFLQALSQQRLAASAHERDQTLFNEGIIAQRRQLETQSQYEEQTAMLEERKQALLLAGMSPEDIRLLESKRQLSPLLKLRAPATAIVLERGAEPGQRLEISDLIFRIANLDPLWLEIRAPVEFLQTLSIGAAVKVPAYGVEGRLIAIGHDVDPASQTVVVRAEINVGAGSVRPGQYVTASVAGMPGENRYQVPAAAVVRSGQHSIVYVQTGSGFDPRIVTVLGSQGGKTVIEVTLKSDERIAVTGLAAIKGASMGLGGE